MPKSVFSDKYGLFMSLLIKARKDAGYTQAELAPLLEKPQSYVSKYERGERRLDVVELIQICKVLCVKPSDFIEQLEKQDEELKIERSDSTSDSTSSASEGH